MIIIPAIDIKGGRCVRLEQGRMSKETVYSEFPEAMALKWFEQGAERLHIVDLDGAVEGRAKNKDVIGKIVKAVPIPLQLGGGIRNIDTIASYLDQGVQDVILGTVAHKDPEFLEQACKNFPGQIILAIDARGDRVAVEGWTEETGVSPSEMAKKYDGAGISAIIYTDIQRDGMSAGPNIEGTKALAEAIETPVIASGGISGIKDVSRILTLSGSGVTAMITGRALYNGALDLTEAIKLTGRQKKVL